MSGHDRDRWHEFDDDDVSTFSLARSSRPPSSLPPPAGPTPADLAKEWHTFEREIQHGPLSKLEIGEMLRAGQLTEEAEIWCKGHEHWLPLRAYPELRALLEPEPTSTSADTTQPSAAAAVPLGTARPAEVPAASHESLLPLATPVIEEPNPFRSPSLAQRLRTVSPWIAVASAVVAGLGASYVFFGGNGQAAARNPSSALAAATDPIDVGSSDVPSYRVQLGVSSVESRPAVKKLVERSAGDVERDCWRPARTTREVSAPPDASVAVELTVKRSGRVDRALVRKDPAGYPGLGACVVREVRDWGFDRLPQDTNVALTFHFSLSR